MGEGPRALQWVREEILRRTADVTILAWNEPRRGSLICVPLLEHSAQSPSIGVLDTRHPAEVNVSSATTLRLFHPVPQYPDWDINAPAHDYVTIVHCHQQNDGLHAG
jgi:hypothetical protein